MRKSYFAVLGSAAVLTASYAQQTGITVEEYEPKSTLVVPRTEITRAKYPFVDVHLHVADKPDQLLKTMDSLNMRVMVTSFVRGGFGETLKKRIDSLRAASPDRFVVFGNIDYKGLDDPDYRDRAASQVEKDIQAGSRGLKVWKDFGMMLKDKDGKRIAVDDPRFDKVFEVCGKYKIPVLIHTADPKQFWEPMDKYNERWLDLKLHPNRARTGEPTWDTLIAEQHRLFAKHPRTIFINAHLGWLGYDLGRLSALLDRLPNVYVELAATIVELGRQPRAARAFFTKYQDRVLFGKDTWRAEEYANYFRTVETGDEYFDHERKYQGIWKIYGMELPDAVLRKLYYRNALKVVPGISRDLFPAN
ncbi:MAG: amidohydrolase family protein [Bryobacteraceae bacterium]|nr:amidohydrolase family protein [Bryobacteraceae bacterium]